MELSGVVDVIIPVYNQRELTRTCIQSVLNSHNAVEYELMVVNDASNDRELNDYLLELSKKGTITLIENANNLGFTKSVNLGMKLHPDRDVVLLNSDTCVYGNWLDRLKDAAYSDKLVATAIPLSNASHISNYPFGDSNHDVLLEIDDASLDLLASSMGSEYAYVHTTVGFCMFIKREVLNDIGCFDEQHFPVGYGEESDFCYRARKVGWKHLVAGNIFIRHFEGQSFGDKKKKLMSDMIEKFNTLHPDFIEQDQIFLSANPLVKIRANLDLRRIKNLISHQNYLHVFSNIDVDGDFPSGEKVSLVFSENDNSLSFIAAKGLAFPNLITFKIPRNIVSLNATLGFLGIEKLICFDEHIAGHLKRMIAPQLDEELTLSAKLEILQN